MDIIYIADPWIKCQKVSVKIKTARLRRESSYENIVKNVLLKEESFLLHRSASTKSDSVLFYTYNLECFVNVMGESRGRRSHHHRSLASCSETFTPCPVHGNKRSHCGNGHNRSSPAVSHRIQFRHEAGRETWLLRAIISSRCNAAVPWLESTVAISNDVATNASRRDALMLRILLLPARSLWFWKWEIRFYCHSYLPCNKVGNCGKLPQYGVYILYMFISLSFFSFF